MRFFPRFEHFVKIDILSQSDLEFYKWKSYVETQLKRLADSINKDLRENLVELRLNPRAFSR